MGVRGFLLFGASLCVLASPAWAQDRPVLALVEEPAPATATDVGDIIVTARRRSESLQDVPIAVSAISAESALRSGITNSEAITIATPSLDFSRQVGQGATPFLRGVGSTQAVPGGESPLAIYVDDVYVGAPSSSLFALNNIASIQVLKGPQGTLFGRNATAGVIQVETKRPDFSPSIEASAGYGNFDTIEGSFYGTTALSDRVAVNFAASGRDQADGFGRSVTTGAETQLGWDWNVRAQLLWQVSDATEIHLSADYSQQSSDFGVNASTIPGTVSVSGGTFVGAYNTQIADLDYTHIDQGGGSLKVSHEAGFADIVSISAYRWSRLDARIDGDTAPPNFLTAVTEAPTDTFTQELRLVSNSDGAFDWVLGAYYLYSKTSYDRFEQGGLLFGPTAPVFNNDISQKLNSISGFAEATYQLGEATNATLGIRYTSDAYSLDMRGRFTSTGAMLPGTAFRRKDDFAKLTYRGIIDHNITQDIMLYASYSRGFKSGGYNLQTPGTAAAQSPAIEPEVLDAFEVGMKTKLFDDMLTLNGAAYYYDYANLAVNLVAPTGSIIINAGKARIKGFDIDFAARLADGLQLIGGLGVIDGEYTSFPNGPLLIPNPSVCTPTPMPLPGPRTGGNRQCAADLAGKRIVRAPKFTLSLTPTYSFSTGLGQVTIAGTYYHNSGFFWDAANQLRQRPYDIINASVALATSRHTDIRFWMRNALDERYQSYAASATFRDIYAYAPPRTYGVTLSARY